MRDEMRFTMVSPAPGFTARVMTRIVEHERARARRRALIGSALLVSAAGAVLGFAAIQLVSALWILITNPQVVFATLDAFQVPTFWAGKVLEAFWIAANAIAENLDPIQMMLGAVAIFALTMLWVRVVTGSFQLSQIVTSQGSNRLQV
jgi:hypothetical protein